MNFKRPLLAIFAISLALTPAVYLNDARASAQEAKPAAAPAKRCTGGSANSCANGGARNGARYCRPVRRRSANLFVGKPSAIVIVVVELLETSARAWEGHYAGAGRNAGAGGQRGYRHQG